jgi:hypothetical protein
VFLLSWDKFFFSLICFCSICCRCQWLNYQTAASTILWLWRSRWNLESLHANTCRQYLLFSLSLYGLLVSR